MSQGKMRLGRMASWQRKSSYFVFSATLATGLVWFVLGDLFEYMPPQLKIWWIAHGLTGLLSIIWIGAAMPQHIVVAWRAHRNRWGGSIATLFIALLLISTALLYYGPELVRENVRWIHIGLGISLLIIFPWHIIRGRKSGGRVKSFIKSN